MKKLSRKNIESELSEYWSGLQYHLQYNLDSVELSLGVDGDWLIVLKGVKNHKSFKVFAEEVDLEDREIEIIKSVLVNGSEVVFKLDNLDVSVVSDYTSRFLYEDKNHNDYEAWTDKVLAEIEELLVGSDDAIDYTIMDLYLLLERLVEGQELKELRYEINSFIANVYDGETKVEGFLPGEFVKSQYLLDLETALCDKTSRNVDLLTYGFDFDRPVVESKLEKHIKYEGFELKVEVKDKYLNFILDGASSITLPLIVSIKDKPKVSYTLTNKDLARKMGLTVLSDLAEKIVNDLYGRMEDFNGIVGDLNDFERVVFKQLVKIVNQRVIKQHYQWDDDKLVIIKENIRR